jgi:hypothetical protein
MALPAMVLTIVTDFIAKLHSYVYGSSIANPVTSDTDADIITVDNRGSVGLSLQIVNSHATNGLIYTIYGTDSETIPATFAAGPWEAVSGATGTLTAGQNLTVNITTQYAFVLVRARRQTTGLSSQIDIYAREK